MIALYYSGMVAAGSSVYAKAPGGSTRTTFLREPHRQVLYSSAVAFTTFLVSLPTDFLRDWLLARPLAFPLLVLLSGVSVLSFVHLGQQAFNLFDPTRLVEPSSKIWKESVTGHGF